MSARILIIGGGGRENALAWKLSDSAHVREIFVCPGNAGTAQENKTQNVAFDCNDHQEVERWCKENEIDLVVVGPEAPLADGITDFLSKNGISCFGPSQSASRIESSKTYAKYFMQKYNIPTARWAAFDDTEEVSKHVNEASYGALVVKADGLAAGKGVFVTNEKQEAITVAENMLQGKKLGDAGTSIVIEERLTGEEISVLAFCDGTSVAAFPAAQDFKRLNENDSSPNTGGMGAYSPVNHVSNEAILFIKEKILQKTISGLREEGCPFVGILYAGLMMTKDGPKVLEFNCRFGDPETQVLLPLLKSDLYEVMVSCVKGDLHVCNPSFYDNEFAVAVVLASGGYPGSYKKGMTINGLEDCKTLSNVKVFHAGTTMANDQVITSGGRVLAVTGMGSTLHDARSDAYEGVKRISFNDMIHRDDIAKKAFGFQRSVSYFSSGVDIDAGVSLVEAIKPLAKATARKGCTPDLGGFGGIFDLKACNFKDPLLVSGTDGVGTKLKVFKEKICLQHS